MSRDASGTYTAPSNSFNPAVEGQTIDESDWNTTLQDIEDALTDSLSISGKGKVTAHVDFDETTVASPSANVGRLYVADVGGVTTLKFKDSGGTDYNLLLSSPGLAYTFSTSTTTNADPGSGYVRFNNATLGSVTEIAIDDNDANGADLSAFVLTWDDVGTSDRGTLIIQNRTAPANVVIFTISGASTDESGFTRLAVTYVTHAGSFSANAPLGVTYTKPGATGATGATGSNGAAGTNGTDPGIRWLFDSSTTTNADPGSGDLRLNNATLASVTEIAISYSSGETGNPSVENFVKAWDDSTTTGTRGTLILKKASAPENFAIYTITSAITDGTTYGRFTLSYVAGSGSFSNTDTLAVQFVRTGDKGADGAGTGDVTGPAASVDSEIALFSSTTGKVIKRASTTGLLKASSGVIAAAVAGTDYVAPGGALGTPSSGTLTNATGLPISTGVSGLGTGVATFLATPSSANLAAAVTGVTGSGALVFATSPTLVTPILGTPTSGTLTNCTGLPVAGITSSTSTALGVGSLELGHASDTTLARLAAGVPTVEGVAVGLQGYATTATAAGTTTLTVSSARYQFFTGTSTQTVVLPVTSTLTTGFRFTVVNNSTGVVTVQSSGANNVLVMGPSSEADFVCILTSGTSAASWQALTRYQNTPINSQSAAYTTVLSDAGKTILHPTADNNARTFTIDSNANVPYPIGTVISFVNQINTVTISITSDTMTLSSAGTTGSRTLAANGVATAIKVASTSWMISGSGLT